MISKLLTKLAELTMQKVLILALIIGGVYYYFIFDDGSAIDAKIATLSTQLKEEEARSQESDAALKEVELIRAAVGSLSDQFKVASQQLPSEVQMSEIIKDVDDVARQSGVSFKSREPKPSLQKDFLEEMPLGIQVEGSFSQITLFLYKLATLERIMHVSQFSLSNQGTSNKLSFDGQILGYRFLGEQKVEPKK